MFPIEKINFLTGYLPIITTTCERATLPQERKLKGALPFTTFPKV
jgi:hypothetical protein